jgi:hypothetical protein
LPPLSRVAEVVPETEADFSGVAHDNYLRKSDNSFDNYLSAVPRLREVCIDDPSHATRLCICEDV